MVQSIFPLGKSASPLSSPEKRRNLGFEIALPLTILAFIAIADQSPLMKMHLDRIVDWLCDHDSVFVAVAYGIAFIPIWMIAVIVYERKNVKRQR